MNPNVGPGKILLEIFGTGEISIKWRIPGSVSEDVIVPDIR